MLIRKNIVSTTRTNNHRRIGPLIALGLMHRQPRLRHILPPLDLLLLRQWLHQQLLTHFPSLLARGLAWPKWYHFAFSSLCSVFCDGNGSNAQTNPLHKITTRYHGFSDSS